MKSFEDWKHLIKYVPKLCFLQDNKEVYLTTEASQHAIGAYLYQTIECPVALISHSLTPQQRQWPTLDREAYAIYFALT